MPAEAYELVALGARYWFAFLGVVIVWRSFSWLRKDGRLRRKRLRQLPDAGMVGELVVLAGSGELPAGTVIPLPREGTMGSLRICDVCLPCPGVAGKHLTFQFRDGLGLVITPWPRQEATVDGETVFYKGEQAMYHGSRLIVGDAVLRMRLFMGLSTARSAAFQEEEYDREEAGAAAQDSPAPGSAWDWRENSVIYHQSLQDWQEEEREDAGEPEDSWEEDSWRDAREEYGDRRPPEEPWEDADTEQAPRGIFHRKRR